MRDEMNDTLLMRYNRQIMMPDFDIAGQEALRNSSALVIGLGGLGCPAAMYLGAAGCGRMVLADFDAVDLSNLQRQIAHREQDVGVNKAESVRRALADINPDVSVETITLPLQDESLSAAIADVDVVLDCTDNFATRSAVNEACVRHGKPLVSGAAIRSEGQLAVFDPRRDDAPCYHCLYGMLSEQQLTCSEAGVIAPLVGVIGSLQALEAVKILSGFGDTCAGRLLLLDGKTMQWREFKVRKDPSCAVCG
ncbi:molybdopterin-synthase adenylyltransferase MoeB [Hahella sp. KA22]|uniref:molybdopterin-synthase adenylyltransferase MoeB n=1 Tax=Hahella sp. KA22 TaxID=1628392 RepID=UPI000FDDDF98|nr:molybdopterin-synthase adenylyltransferase MoeB [Hahella sp. KA22]AZZ93731.1 molybdopterin-synthase adenylyltransferase MoeB [Hahella sp. KA22]QAY57106.1 molybdopterin-synthase adenylyltransferase MoeB [Hahella sp. KA22]